MKTMREKLLEQLKTAVGEERVRILAKLVVLDEEMESKKAKQDYFKKNWSLRNKKESEDEEEVEGKMKKIFLHITWYCKDKRRDPDNVAAAVKFIWDGLVAAGVIENDGWTQNAGWTNRFEVDEDNPRVEIELEEVS